jgi:hypothetical protein
MSTKNILSLSSLLSLLPLSQVYGQGLSTYENPDFELKFQYPSHWTIEQEPFHPWYGGNIPDALVVNFVEETFGIIALNKLGILIITTNATSVEDYLKSEFQDKSASDADGYTFVNDNQP